MDISGEEISSFYNEQECKRFIKTIKNDDCIELTEYNHKDDFIQVAEIIKDCELKENGSKKRNTLIQFVPLISNKEFKEKCEWLYLFTINNKIVKIGGTRTGLHGRIGSYLCGHHIKERGKSGDCSKTNGYIYNTFKFYLDLNCKILMYGFKLPKQELDIKILDKDVKIYPQIYHIYESYYIDDFNKEYKFIPVLCDNYDPRFKS